MWMHSTDSERMSRKLRYNNEINPLSVSAEEGSEMIQVVRAERDDLLLQLKYYNVSKENFARKVPE